MRTHITAIAFFTLAAICHLVKAGEVEMSLFDERDLIEFRRDVYPGERLMVCRNPLLAVEWASKRGELLKATEALLEPIAEATRREKRPLKGVEKIGLRVDKVIGKHKRAKHFVWEIDDEGFFSYRRDEASITSELALDGLYVVRTNLTQDDLDARSVVAAYKHLSTVERAFRSLKTVDLRIRPMFHYTAEQMRDHVLLCMLAYHVE